MLLLIYTDISTTSWILSVIAIIILGLSKSGLKGIAIIVVSLMAIAFGAKESTGLIVPILIVGDIYAVIYYNRHAQWHYIVRFLPWMILGVIFGALIGKDLDEHTFKIGISTIILVSAGMMFWWDSRKSIKVPTHWAFAGSMGILSGITTMIGNLAGAFANIFFLALRLPKNQFIGTAAWIFFIVNIFKLLCHIFIWKTVSLSTLGINLTLLPALFIGLFIGVRVVKIIKDDFYRKMILVLTAIGAIIILLK
ncbi:sulfite exporter TauE/SafE family protein [Cellulophaga baltica]|uniref:sulfite exporter TauE/SafE family protein n=1 Tax=Cellulophaga TaxID=104264 RepID=UPI001C06AB57|nr:MULTISPECIES: sulfite exporter TauE/SafE family protein [Cellulophaga]MBU2995819.1 sulfite exporter TauE/SafE family protein [Cellulophaga baltica]MDO6767214.1 sulfite exporter TauE/SafE family protein [Cellulophaga sp. 1_MG-2023]